MTNLFNPRKAIEVVWEMVENIPSAKGKAAIAGGAVADAYFNKGSRDIDVFVSQSELERVQKFADYYRFEVIGEEAAFRMATDSYGNARRVRIGGESPIVTVFRGFLIGYPVEIVVVREDDITEHITKNFDQSVKTCWYDGEYHYSDAFMKTVKTKKITPIRHEAGEYVRAWLSAEKYGLSLSYLYELSKHYTGYAYQEDKLEEVLSKSTIRKIEGFEEKLFNFDAEEANVILMDTFLTHERNNKSLYKRLCKIARNDTVVEHDLHGKEVKVTIQSSEIVKFIKIIHSIKRNAIQDFFFGEVTPEEREALKSLNPLTTLSEEEFVQGKVTVEGRTYRIGKYLNKVQREHKEKFGTPEVQEEFQRAIKVLETRSATQSAKVFFTGSKHALTHISTDTPWTSCQRWDGFGTSLGTNYGLLANVSGSTLVAYVSKEENDRHPENWHARILVRLGENNELFLERVYSNRKEYQRENLRQAVAGALRKLGYNVFTTAEEAMDFQGLPMWSSAYNDCAYALNMISKGREYFFRGRREEIERDRRQEAIDEYVLETLKEDVTFMKINTYERAAIVSMTPEWQKEVEWLFDNMIYSDIYQVYAPIPNREKLVTKKYSVLNICIQKLEGEYVVVVSQSVPWHRRNQNNEIPLHRPVGIRVVPAGADMDGDLPF